jgi:phosphate transport system substrate-binding protein
VNSSATWINEITTAELKKIWEPSAQGSVVRWYQINAAWPDQFFQLLGSASNSSLHSYFVESIIGQPRATRGDYIGSDVLNFVTNGVSQYSGAIGYVHYTSEIVPASQVKALKIVNAAGEAVSPSESAFVDASYNPLSRPLFIYVNAEQAKRPEIRAFVKFLLTQGTKSIRRASAVPLPDDMYESVLAKFVGGKAGTVFDGESAIGVQLDEAMARDPMQ